MEATMRDPVLGNFENGRDNFETKNIDILDDDGSVGNTIVSTEWFAELCYAGFWQINPAWLAAQQPDEPAAKPELGPDKDEPAEIAQ